MVNDDLMYFLGQKYKTEEEGKLDEKASKLDKSRLSSKLDAVDSFVDFARKYLTAHPPTAFDYSCEGCAVLFHDGETPQRKRFVPKVESEDFDMNEGEVPITKSARQTKYKDLQPTEYFKV